MVIKQSVVDVLMFLFERFLGDDNETLNERDDVATRLEEMGFQNNEIDKAFDWLEDLATIQDGGFYAPVNQASIRVYSEEEKAILNEESQGYLVYLEQAGVLTPVTRELILDRVIALDNELDTEQLKWIVLIVLHSHPGEENAYAWMESIMFDEFVDYIQ
jgi:Smg protein